MSIPVVLMAMALGIEASNWTAQKVKLQRIADVAAMDGAIQYAATTNARGAAGYALDMAEINGIAGSSRSWDGGSLKLSETLVTAQIVSGLISGSNKAVQVTVQQNVPKALSLIVSSGQSSVTVTATAIAEVGSLGAQPCITALGGGVDGITTGTDISVGGTASLVGTNCSLRANDAISQNGGGSIHTTSVYAGGTIANSGICCDLHANAGQIADPYANNTQVRNALNALHAGNGSAVSVKSNNSSTINPGTFSSWDINGTLILNPGLYTVNGDISASAQSIISGTGVTIVLSGAVNLTGGSSLSLSAATTAAASHSAIPGVLIAGTSSSSMSFLGNSTSPVTGLIYLPQASLKFGGTTSSGSSGCTEVIASTVTLVGTSGMAANCSDYGLLGFGSLPGPPVVTLVQ